jgi:3-oxoacyl-[acyl-carrier-protein] synthase-3
VPSNATSRVKIAGIGKYLPERIVPSAELEEQLGLGKGWIENATGVAERRRAAPGETQSTMGAAAARAALADAKATLADVDLIVCGSAGSQQAIPCTAVLIQRELGLGGTGVPCFDVNSTCLGFVTGLDIAACFIERGTYRSALVISSDVASVIVNWEEHESAVLFGDGAAAAFVTRAAEGEASVMWPARLTTDSGGIELAELKGGGTGNPPNRTDFPRSWNLFHMEGGKILRYALKLSVPFMASYFETLPFPIGDVHALVPHQASLLAVRLAARACGFRDDQLLLNLANHGNCGAASIPMVLHDGVRSGRIKRGDRVVLAGTAAGLAVGALALVY